MSPKQIVMAVLAVIVVGISAIILYLAMGICDAQEWIVVQPLAGKVRIQENPGPYWKGFAKTWAYPRNIEFRYNDDVNDGDAPKESIRVTFNDGGTAQVSTYIRLQTPILEEDRLEFHRQFGGIQDNIKASIKSFMIDCMKSTAPLMSASEHQSARKSEFRQLVLDQMSNGLYDMNLEEVVKKDETDETGEEITLFKTSIVLIDGKPVVTTKSPIVEKFNMEVTQFSVTGTDYDIETQKQFAAKKESFLGAEQAKAERSKEVQERLMIVEKGLREMAEATAAANVIKEKAVVEAQQKAEVALQVKKEKETEAEMLLSVAEIAKQEAQVKLDTAKIDAEAIIELAKAEQEKIRLAGAITELEQALIDAEVQVKIGQAEHFSKIAVPSTVIGGSSGSNNGSVNGNALQDNLMSIFMLKMINGGNLDSFGQIKSVDMDNREITQQNAVDPNNTRVAQK